jgi:hypothetical protein
MRKTVKAPWRKQSFGETCCKAETWLVCYLSRALKVGHLQLAEFRGVSVTVQSYYSQISRAFMHWLNALDLLHGYLWAARSALPLPSA